MMATLTSEPLAPGAVVGVLGGGQLGRMIALAAAPLGYRCHIYGPSSDEPAKQVTSLQTTAPYDDDASLEAFARTVDVVTLEFENIPLATVRRLAETVPVRPSPQVLEICQHRQREKSFCETLGIPTSPFRAIGTAQELEAAVAGIGTPCVLKTAEMGYDGKGQSLIRTPAEAADAWRAVAGERTRCAAILEGFVDFRMEASVIVARGLDGAMQCFGPMENRHRDHILHETIVPAALTGETRAQALAVACRLAEAIDLVGLVAVELFVTQDGSVLVNELAPRPHNSGHWTIDACTTSQFEQVVRAITGLPLGSTEPLADATMENLLGDEVRRWREIVAEPAAKLHLYGKGEVRPGRKMGHVTRFVRRE